MRAARGLSSATVVLLITFLLALPSSARPFQDLAPAGLADGAGLWVNLWHYPEGDLDAYCTQLQQHGIRNLFIQTSRSNTEAIRQPDRLGAVIEASHRHRIRVIAWSFAELVDPEADAEKLIAAARFESPQGERLDGVAGNLEKNLAKWRVESYSQHLREALGKSYPMIAVVYSPLNQAPQVAVTPWQTLAQYWDVLAPMTYWGGKHQTLDAYSYTTASIQSIRKLVGRPDMEIHAIGDGMGTSRADLEKFLKACQDAEATSASLYPNHVPTLDQLDCLAKYSDYFPANSRFRLAAFHELLTAGVMHSPAHGDPARPISRGEFYRLVVRLLYPPTWLKADSNAQAPAPDIEPADALKILSRAGLVPAYDRQDVLADSLAQDEALAGPIDSREALSLISRLVELRTTARSAARGRQPKGADKARSRADRWLVPPASAEAEQAPAHNVHLVNHLDAAQMVLQAHAGLR